MLKMGRNSRIWRALPVLVVLWAHAGSCFALPAAPSTEVAVQLGPATVALNGPWKFKTGDNPAWAQPDFDDSSWNSLDLTPPSRSFDPFLGNTDFVPGWTARGYAGYSGYAWYRLRVRATSVTGETQQKLAIKMPDNCDDAYQVFVNGILLGSLGHFTSNGVTTYLVRPRAFKLPVLGKSDIITISIRTWMDPGTALMAAQAGGLHGPPVLGQDNAVLAMLRLDWETLNRTNYSHVLECGALLLSLLFILVLGNLDRNEPIYLWLGLCCGVTLVILLLILEGDYTNLISRSTVAVLQDDFLFPARIGLWIIFWGHWFRLSSMKWLHQMTWGLVVLLAIGTALQRPPIYGSLIPVHAADWLVPMTVVLKLTLGGLLVWVAYQGMKHDWADGLLALPAVVLVALAQYHYELIQLGVKVYYFPFGYRIALSQISIILSLAIITLLLFRRFLATLSDREQMRLEIEQAREVQSLLVPTKAPATPGFTVETVYLPANRVGGDFFQVFSHQDGSLLVVVGDVSGKGMQAAMTVSALVGALRNERSLHPAEILQRLNKVLCGQISGFVTCCVLAVQQDGAICLANAGHPAPYVAGRELKLENSFPLGLDVDTEYRATTELLKQGEQLTIVTDGVVEARNRQGELFGFQRTRSLSTRSASSIAEAALAFGQDDDITVLTLMLATDVTEMAQSGSHTVQSRSFTVTKSYLARDPG
jgi:Stage II sporulation protein E (SpoIIE)